MCRGSRSPRHGQRAPRRPYCSHWLRTGRRMEGPKNDFEEGPTGQYLTRVRQREGCAGPAVCFAGPS
jgi:hypothetical protein